MRKVKRITFFLVITGFFLAVILFLPKNTTVFAEENPEKNTVIVNTYGELLNAIEACNAGDTIKLPDTIYINSRVEITKPLIFCPQNSRSNLIYIKSETSESQDAYPQNYYRHFNINFSVSGGNVSFTDCDFSSDCEGYGGGIYSGSRRSTLTAEGCTFKGMSNTLGGAMFISHYNAQIGIILKNCLFEDNAANKGGCIYLNCAFAEIEGCTFKNNVAYNDGSAVGVYNYKAPVAAKVTVDDCVFFGNTTKSDSNGYAGTLSFIESYVKINDGETCSQSLGTGIVKNSKINSNKAIKSGTVEPRGSAINAENYNLSIENCEIKNNTNEGTGTVAVVYRSSCPNFKIIGTEISENTVLGNVGALCFLSNISGSFEIDNCTFKKNTSLNNKNVFSGSFDTENDVQITPIITLSTIVDIEQEGEGQEGDTLNTDEVVAEIPPENLKEKDLTALWCTLGGLAFIGGVAFLCAFIIRKRKAMRLFVSEQADNGEGLPSTEDIFGLLMDKAERIKTDFRLSQRESEVLNGLLEGKSAKQIAGELYISFDTARYHIKNLYRKLDVHSQTELISFCQKYN